MKKSPMPEPVNLPYATSVANFFGDQGGIQGSSFLGKFFPKGGRSSVSRSFAAPVSSQTGKSFGQPNVIRRNDK